MGGALRDVISVRHAGWYRLTKTVVHSTFLQRFETVLNRMCVCVFSRGLYFVSEKLNIEDMLHNVQHEW